MSEQIRLRYLVAGTGRSGTVSVARLLTALGLPCSHEQLFNGGSLDDARRTLAHGGKNSECSVHCGLDFQGPPVAESSYMAVPFLDSELLRSVALIHVVRDPLHVIRSFLNNVLFFREVQPEYRAPTEQFIYAHLPHLECLPDPVSRACFYYLRWNQLIEESSAGRPYLLYPIERGPQCLLDFLGWTTGDVALPDDRCNAYAQWPEHMRIACDLPAIGDDEIQACFLWKEVAELAARYGYSYSTRVPRRLDTMDAGRSVRSSAVDQPQPERPHCFPVQPRTIEENYIRYNLVQLRDAFFGVHQEIGPLDLTRLAHEEQEQLKSTGRLFVAGSLQALKTRILEFQVAHLAELLRLSTGASFLGGFEDLFEEGYYGFNLVAYRGKVFAVSQALEGVDFRTLDKAELLAHEANGRIFVAETIEQARERIDRERSRGTPALLEEDYHGYNLVAYRGKVFALHRCLGPTDLTGIDEHKLKDQQPGDKLFVGDSLEEVKRVIDQGRRSRSRWARMRR